MTENSNENTPKGPDELTLLKERAAIMGITHHPSIGLEKLKEKVAEALSTEKAAPKETPVKSNKKVREFTAAERASLKKTSLRNEATKLVRIRLTCMNPAKAKWPGEFISVSNRIIGTLTKFIPFNSEEGYHVPHAIYEQLRDRQCQIFVNAPGPKGKSIRKGKLVKEFSIELLDQLDKKALADLAQRQAISQNID